MDDQEIQRRHLPHTGHPVWIPVVGVRDDGILARHGIIGGAGWGREEGIDAATTCRRDFGAVGRRRREVEVLVPGFFLLREDEGRFDDSVAGRQTIVLSDDCE